MQKNSLTMDGSSFDVGESQIIMDIFEQDPTVQQKKQVCMFINDVSKISQRIDSSFAVLSLISLVT